MGDGRYYTFIQFFNVFLITILIVVFLVVFISAIFKISELKIFFIFSGVALFLVLILMFYIEVVVNVSIIPKLYFIINVMIVVYVLIAITFYIYSFFYYNLKRYEVLQIILMLICIGCYIYFNSLRLIAIVFIIHYFVMVYVNMEYKAGINVFASVKKMMLDYVFIIQDDGLVIFKNDKVRTSILFKDVNKIDINDIQSIFANKIKFSDDYFKQLIEIDSYKKFFFQYQIKDILREKNKIGYIITFVDVTEFINILGEINENRENLFKINVQLAGYKEKVYEIEREKEIDLLLDEIATNQYSLMKKLKKDIKNLSFDDENLEQKIDELLVLSKNDLKKVRDAVNTYVNY